MSAVGRIHDQATFRALARPAGRASRGAIRVSYVPGSAGGPASARVGYAIGRRCGSAVTRNRLRRRLRAIVAQARPGLEPGAYLVLTAPEATSLRFAELAAAVRSAMEAAAGRAREVAR
jgi:ribonuclease P protein component